MVSRHPTETPSCYRHLLVKRVARCEACGAPICQACITRTSRGINCPECALHPTKTQETAVAWRSSSPLKPRRFRWFRVRRALMWLAIIGLVVVTAVTTSRAFRPERLAPSVPITTNGSFKFIATNGSTPVTYDPCKSIRYELNLDKAPPGVEAILGMAMQEVERATGLRFEYVGTTERRPLDDASPTINLKGARPRPVVIMWATAEEAPRFRGNVAGYAGSSHETGPGRSDHFLTGSVVFNSTTFARLMNDPSGSAQARAIALHELGHLVGLDHVSDPNELMNAENLGLHEFGPGDRAGLAMLGQGACA